MDVQGLTDDELIRWLRNVKAELDELRKHEAKIVTRIAGKAGQISRTKNLDPAYDDSVSDLDKVRGRISDLVKNNNDLTNEYIRRHGRMP